MEQMFIDNIYIKLQTLSANRRNFDRLISEIYCATLLNMLMADFFLLPHPTEGIKSHFYCSISNTFNVLLYHFVLSAHDGFAP